MNVTLQGYLEMYHHFGRDLNQPCLQLFLSDWQFFLNREHLRCDNERVVVVEEDADLGVVDDKGLLAKSLEILEVDAALVLVVLVGFVVAEG